MQLNNYLDAGARNVRMVVVRSRGSEKVAPSSFPVLIYKCDKRRDERARGARGIPSNLNEEKIVFTAISSRRKNKEFEI